MARLLASLCISISSLLCFVSAQKPSPSPANTGDLADDDCTPNPTTIPSYFVPFGPGEGDQVAPPNDDGSLGPLALQEPFKFFDETHRQVYINTNGGFTFLNSEGDFTPERFPLFYDTIVAYWADIDTTENDGRIHYRQTRDRTVLDNVRHLQRLPSSGDFSALVATWHNVTYFGGSMCTEINTFQMLLVSSGNASFAVISYAELRWVLSATSTTAQAGYNSASSGRYYELPGAMSTFPNTFLTSSNVNVPGQWVFRLDGGSDDLCQGSADIDIGDVNEAYPHLDPCNLKLTGPTVIDNSYIVFKCQVTLTAPDPDARAEVTFLIDGVELPSVPSEIVTPGTDPDVELHERHLYNNMGKSVQCSVSTFYQSGSGERGPLIYSNSYHVGVKSTDGLLLLDPGIDEPITTTLYTTLPIICAGSASSSSCHLEVRLTTSNKVVVRTTADYCSYTIEADDWDESSQRAHNDQNLLRIRISPLAFPVTRGVDRISITLDVAARSLHPSTKLDGNALAYDNFWHSQTLGEILVTRSSATAAQCISTGDPRIRPFDYTSYYASNQLGVFEYVVGSSPRVFRVEIRHWACTEGETGCSIGCAVAVREGNVAYGLDMCNSNKTVHRLRLSPQSLSYEPISADRSKTRWTISMPSGAIIRAYIRTWGRGGMNVYINVPARDRNQTTGLCGTFDGDPNNDFTLPDGTVTFDVDEFIESYRVPPEESLFDITAFQEIPDLPNDEDFCSCDVYDPNSSRCGPILTGDGDDTIIANTVGGPGVQVIGRRRRDTTVEQRTDNIDDTYVFGPVEEDSSNPEPNGWPTSSGVTEDQAYSYCSSVLSRYNPSVCQEFVSNATLEEIIDTCMDDVELTGQLIWAEDKIADVVETCDFSVANSPENADRNDSSILSQLTAIAAQVCPQQCSGQGTCQDGQCQCDPGFVGPDCSISEGQAPEITALLSPILCDVALRLCESVRLLADYLVIDAAIICQVDIRMMDGSELTTQSPGVVVSYNEVECPLSSLYTIDAGSGPAPFYRYNISLSNDGVVLSTQLSVPGAPIGLVVYDSDCIQCSDDGNCTQKVGTCIVEGRCQPCEGPTTEDPSPPLGPPAVPQFVAMVGGIVGAVVLVVGVAAIVAVTRIKGPQAASNGDSSGSHRKSATSKRGAANPFVSNISLGP